LAEVGPWAINRSRTSTGLTPMTQKQQIQDSA